MGRNSMKSDDVYVLRDLGKFQSVTDVLKSRGLTCEYRVLESRILEANRFISRMLKVPLASKIFYFQKLRIVGGIPKSIEKDYILYDKVKGVEQADLGSLSFYAILQEQFGYVTQKSEEEILIVNASPEEQKLLNCQDKELLMIKGITYLSDSDPFEYFEIVSISDFYRFRSVTEYDGV